MLVNMGFELVRSLDAAVLLAPLVTIEVQVVVREGDKDAWFVHEDDTGVFSDESEVETRFEIMNDVNVGFGLKTFGRTIPVDSE